MEHSFANLSLHGNGTNSLENGLLAWYNSRLRVQNQSQHSSLGDIIFSGYPLIAVLSSFATGWYSGGPLPVGGQQITEEQRMNYLRAIGGFLHSMVPSVNYDIDALERRDQAAAVDLAWQIALHFQLSPGNPQFTRAEREQAARQSILNFVNFRIQGYHFPVVEDLTRSLTNGMVLCAVMHSVNPELFPWNTITPNRAAENCQLALVVANDCFCVDPILSVEGIVSGQSDERTVILYLSDVLRATQFYMKARTPPPTTTNTAAPTSAHVHSSSAPAAVATSARENVTPAWSSSGVSTSSSVDPRPASAPLRRSGGAFGTRSAAVPASPRASAPADVRTDASVRVGSGNVLQTHLSSQQAPRLEVAHSFTRKHFSRPTYCAVCSNFLWGIGKQGYRCDLCPTSVHSKCRKDVPNSCKPFAYPDGQPGASAPTVQMREHHFVRGNVEPAKCAECKRKFQMQGCMDAQECTYCHIAIHILCTRPDHMECNPPLGPLMYYGPSYDNVLNTPLIAFVNSRSGGRQGAGIMKKLNRLLTKSQVFDLSDGGPGPGLQKFLATPRLKILACGGDGTVGWILSILDDIPNLPIYPPIAVLPLGTGNDLARSLNWGPGYDGESLLNILSEVKKAAVTPMDRWSLVCTPLQDDVVEPAKFMINNYFSIGVDAGITLDFHEKREASPNLFQNRLVNKGWYGHYGMKAMVSNAGPLASRLQLWVDGTPIVLDAHVEGVIVLNVPSYAAGTDMWGKKTEPGFRPASYSDGLLEVVAISGVLHMSKIRGGLTSATRLGQGQHVKIVNNDPLAAQVDGEPWMLQPCNSVINFFNRANMLVAE